MRRLLVIGDEPQLRQSVAPLLTEQRVDVAVASSTTDALTQLRDGRFDCVLADLATTSREVVSLLDAMSASDRYTMPPVIVHVGSSATREQVRQLGDFSDSLVVKVASSFERVLDEALLFLHLPESVLPREQLRCLQRARQRDPILEERTILIVEDDVRNVFALTSAVEPRGARTAIARNGREALALLETDARVDLVLMDIMMPELDGIDATRAIRKHLRRRALPIIALTAKAMREDQERCLAAGANDYLAKPIDIETLLSLIRVWMPRW
ncbi:MAG: response regulator [Polyangiales bacterium]